MALNFKIAGPIYNFDDETKIHFKRVSSKQVFQWELENSVLFGRSTEELKQFAERASQGISNWDFYTGKENALLSQLSSKFCCSFVEKVEGVVDESGEDLNYFDLTEEQQFRFWDQLQEVNSFIDWLSKYKAGGEKKSSSMAEDN